MKKPTLSPGVIAALLERLEKQRLPRLLSMQERVNNGEVLSDFDLGFLKEIHADASRIKPMLDEKPEYHLLVIRLIGLCKDITDKALENEKGLH